MAQVKRRKRKTLPKWSPRPTAPEMNHIGFRFDMLQPLFIWYPALEPTSPLPSVILPLGIHGAAVMVDHVPHVLCWDT